MNYRCFGAEEQVISINELTAFIGNNSAGKTAALSALNCIFSENSSDRILQRSDFHLPKEMAPDEMEHQNLYVEAVFEFEELRAAAGSGKYAIPIFSNTSLLIILVDCRIYEFVLRPLGRKAVRLMVRLTVR